VKTLSVAHRPRIARRAVWERGVIVGQRTTVRMYRADGSVVTRTTMDPTEEMAIIEEFRRLGLADQEQEVRDYAATVDSLPDDEMVPLLVACVYLEIDPRRNKRKPALSRWGLKTVLLPGRTRNWAVRAGDLRAAKARGPQAPERKEAVQLPLLPLPDDVTEVYCQISDVETHIAKLDAKLDAVLAKLDILVARGTPPLDLNMFASVPPGRRGIVA
jgi:hypothetical protein